MVYHNFIDKEKNGEKTPNSNRPLLGYIGTKSMQIQVQHVGQHHHLLNQPQSKSRYTQPALYYIAWEDQDVNILQNLGPVSHPT